MNAERGHNTEVINRSLYLVTGHSVWELVRIENIVFVGMEINVEGVISNFYIVSYTCDL